MKKQDVVTLLNKSNEIEKKFTPLGGNFMPDIMTISKNVDFQIWVTELKRALQTLKKDSVIDNTLDILDNGFKNSMKDVSDFNRLKANLAVINIHIDEYFEDSIIEINKMNNKLKKGTKIKTTFDEYTLIEQVGSGGNGRVFSAYDSNSQQVAIKFVEKNNSSDKMKRFKNELHFCETHKHKNIVEIYDRGYVFLDEIDYAFYVMPLYKETLRKKMKSGLNSEQALAIFVGIIEGLGYAHKNGAIHRDIKPENIMFKSNSDEPIICDFGIAHFATDDLFTIIQTKKGDRLANFQYAAPEQRKKDGITVPQTDLYATALILNEMFTNEVPQASDHKTIESVDSDYKYLDIVFDKLYKQNAEDRLYPELKILSEMKVLAENYHREKEKKHLQSVIEKTITPETFEAKIISKRYVDGDLVIQFDQKLPSEWFNIISNPYELGSYSYLLGYEPSHLRHLTDDKISMRIHESSAKISLVSIFSNISDWANIANKKYNEKVKREIISQQKEREMQRKREIAKLEKEEELNKLLADI